MVDNSEKEYTHTHTVFWKMTWAELFIIIFFVIKNVSSSINCVTFKNRITEQPRNEKFIVSVSASSRVYRIFELLERRLNVVDKVF